MLILVLFAFAFSAFQVFAVTSPARSISWPLCVLAFVGGMSATSAITLLIEQGIVTLWLANDPGVSLREVVTKGAYRQDPLLEEFCKILPLIALILVPRVRRALGNTDIVILAAALGTGFGFMESALNLGALFARADYPPSWRSWFLIYPAGGFGLNRVAVPAPWFAVLSWLPNGFSLRPVMAPLTMMLNLHGVWSVFVGAGLAMFAKARPRYWAIACLLIAYAVLDHTGTNAQAAHVELPLGLSTLLIMLEPFRGLLAFLIMASMVLADRLLLRRAIAKESLLQLPGEQDRWLAIPRLFLANIRSIAALKLLWRFILERRTYLTASANGERGEAHAAHRARLVSFVRSLQRGDNEGPDTPSISAADAAQAGTWQRLGGRMLRFCAILLAIPPLLYWTMVGFVPSSMVRAIFDNRVAVAVLVLLLAMGMLVQAGTAVTHLRSLLKEDVNAFSQAVLGRCLVLTAAVGGMVFTCMMALATMGDASPLVQIGAVHAIAHWLNSHPLAAAMLALAAAVLTVLVPLAVAIFLREVGFGIGVVQALTGRDLLTGQRLSLLERAIGLIPGGKSGKVTVKGSVKGAGGVAQAAESLSFGTRQAAREALDGPLGTAANRFFRDAARNAQGFRITDLAGNGKKFEFFSPARNAGYGKLYVQEVNATGGIVREYKDTLGPNGLIQRKWIHGGD